MTLEPPQTPSPWPSAKTFCQFIGWPRSGTTLLASLLDAHPDVRISHEADVSLAIAQGASAEDVANRMTKADEEFSSSNRQWFGYDYRIGRSSDSEAPFDAIVVGDKKAGGTAEVVALAPDVLHRTSHVLHLPLRLLVVVRNPFDTITTISRNLDGDLPAWFNAGDDALSSAIDWFLLLASITQRVIDDPSVSTHIVRFDDLIADPVGTVTTVLAYLGVTDLAPEYRADVEKAVFPSPRHPSQEIIWEPQQRNRVLAGMRALPLFDHLKDPS